MKKPQSARGKRETALLAAASLALSVLGCSAKDPPDYTPVYHVGTPTNRSSVNSWELYSDPMHTQPGVYGGKPVKIKPVPSRRGFEPNDPLAESVFAAISADRAVTTQYISTLASRGTVILIGTMPSAAQRSRAVAIARTVPGVHAVRDQIVVQPPRD